MQIEEILDQLPDCRIFSKIKQDEDLEGWKAARSRGIGGSDVGPICGVSGFSSPRLVYLKKTGQYEDTFTNAAEERMEWGHRLEDVVALAYQEKTGNKVIRCPATLHHKDHKWVLGNVDRFIVDDTGKIIGILEVKTGDKVMMQKWDEGDILLSYIYQLQWYMKVTGLRYGAFAALIGGNRYFSYEVFYNERLMNNEIFPTCDKFWNHHVANMIEPDLGPSDADSDWVKEKYQTVVKNSEVKLLTDEADDLARQVKEGRALMKKIDADTREAATKLQALIGNNEFGITPNYIARWAPQKQERVDTDRLRSEFPELFQKVKKTITFRTLTIKGGPVDEDLGI